MRVLFVYKYLTLGGVEAVLRARLEGLVERGIEAHAWFLQAYDGIPMFQGLEDRVHLGSAGECLAFAREGGFDLLCSIDTEEVLGGFPGPGMPRLVVECHSAYLENIEYLRDLRSRPAAILVPSARHAEVVRERVRPEADVRVVPNPLGRPFVAEPAPFEPRPLRPVVCWIGRLDEQKNWKGFLEAAGVLLSRGSPAELWLVGKPAAADGAEPLLRRARETRTLERLRWFRGFPHARIPALLDAVRASGGVLVSTSRGESLGMTVIEGMARACAVAVPGQPPFDEFVEDGRTGLFFRPGVPESAAERVEALLEDAALRAEIGRRAREAALERFSPEAALTLLAAELKRLAGA